jgi:small-conductance mechanosensitive channel
VLEVVSSVPSPAYTVYTAVQHALNTGMLQRFEALGVGFAFPPRTIYMHTVEEPRRAEEPVQIAKRAAGDA